MRSWNRIGIRRQSKTWADADKVRVMAAIIQATEYYMRMQTVATLLPAHAWSEMLGSRGRWSLTHTMSEATSGMCSLRKVDTFMTSVTIVLGVTTRILEFPRRRIQK